MKYIFTLIFSIVSFSLFSQPVQTQHVEVELIPEVQSVQPGGKFWIALRMKMEEHWDVYWRNPGDSGLPTKIKWTLPEGFTAGDIQWPFPEKIILPPLTSFGYYGEIYLLTEITVPENFKTEKPVLISAKATWLVCKEICLPGEAELSFTIPVKNEIPKSDPKWIESFTSARSKLPIILSDWKISTNKQKDKFIISAEKPTWFNGDLSDIQFYPFEQMLIDNYADQKLTKTENGFSLEIVRATDTQVDPQILEGVLVSKEGWRGNNSERGLNISAELNASAEDSSLGKSEGNGLLLSLLFAFLGGIILNLMPCVLPVLSLKIMGFVQQANDEKASILKQGMIFTLGVLVSFWILAGVLIALREGGEQLGWGFQLQSPTFLILLSTFLFLFALSLFGVFEIGTSLTSIGGRTNKPGWAGSFLNGVTATVVATPCTAPFMGSALGYALTQPPLISLLIFTFVGLGMAFPYLLLSSSPKMLKYVPKPGAWMETFKQFMGFFLVGTVLWLIWVLGIQAGNNAVTGLLSALLLSSIAAWILGKWGTLIQTQTKRWITYLISTLIIGLGLYIAISSLEFSTTQPNSESSISSNGIQWENYSPERVEELKASGTPFFLDFTAAWCLSCQVNDKIVFGSKDVITEFKNKNIVGIKADWTSRDEKITKALESFGRNSVPLYVLYKKDGSYNILPELITPGIVLNEIGNL